MLDRNAYWVTDKPWLVDALKKDPFVNSIFNSSFDRFDFFEKLAEMKTQQASEYFEQLTNQRLLSYTPIIVTQEVFDRLSEDLKKKQ